MGQTGRHYGFCNTPVLRTGATGELTTPFASTQGESSQGLGIASTPNEMEPIENQCNSRHNKLGFLISRFECCGFVIFSY